jgi:CheY-like chemotaxis protein
MPPSLPPAALPSSPPRVSRRVLVVDDSRLLRQLISSVLSPRAVVLTAASAEEALEILLHDPAFDLVLCDLNLPGMSGLGLHAILARRLPALAARMVLLTGDERQVSSLPQLCKPVSAEALHALLD